MSLKNVNLRQKLTRDIDTKKAPVKDLVAWYNENSGQAPIKKFRDEKTARTKCEQLKQAVIELSGAGSKGAGAKEAGKKGATGGSAAAGEGEAKERGRKSAFAGKKIYRLGEYKTKNPRREGSHGYKSFALIKDGMTYEDYITAGGRSNDLKWDVDNSYVEVK